MGSKAFADENVLGACEEVQLREQDFGNFQDPGGKKKELAERMEFGRFFYRFPNGESGADVYDRITIFEDHLVRDINAGGFVDVLSYIQEYTIQKPIHILRTLLFRRLCSDDCTNLSQTWLTTEICCSESNLTYVYLFREVRSRKG